MSVGDSLSRNQWQSLTCLLHSAVPDAKHNIPREEDWKDIDMLIFNTWHWWNRREPTQPQDYIQVGGNTYKDMDRTVAFQKVLEIWGGWVVDSNGNLDKTSFLPRDFSLSLQRHSMGGELTAKSCIGKKEPVPGSTFPGGLPLAVAVLKSVHGKIKKPVTLLDITNLSLLRKEWHPSVYGLGGRTTMDCSHWCLAGVPDNWNEILYNHIII